MCKLREPVLLIMSGIWHKMDIDQQKGIELAIEESYNEKNLIDHFNHE